MASPARERRSDLVFMIIVFAVSAVVLVEASRLPASRFDPLGPGAFPLGICVLLLVLTAFGIVKALLGHSLGRAETSLLTGVGQETPYRQHPWLAVALYLSTIAYVCVLQFAPVHFTWPTAAYIVAASLLLSRSLVKRTLLAALAVGASASAILTYIFGHILVVALP
ncbi:MULTISPECIES: tripartite tricarboxylate transporter TctB family protein [unclassified Chelatococcus]|uniref:tripartite tricarboxylate transporter TctB family protein n=1 Tax=unclassified Chelatococcus TaxID=2638111 RepID=UPI001BCF33AB|nr:MULTISPECIES: tripartite tricarboxylate transporter TctB family protein [unclassified Chelatococcus]MBS7700808.1 tripartite tricarboxylate transporter TctB family protein [Chelatococcus sp. YT9]